MNTTLRRLAALLLALLPAAGASAQAAREHGAHEHGHGVLEVAWQGHALHVALRVPAVNVVGFEHAASTDAQRDAVRHALATFKRGQELFVPSAAARCALESAEAVLGEERDHGQEHTHAAKHDKDHDKDHGHAKEHEHEKQAHADAEQHSELHAVWRFHCDAPDKLERIEVKVFEHLLEVDELDAQVVTDALQKAAVLRPGNAKLDLSTR